MTVAACAGLFQVVTRFVLQEPATWSEPLIRMMLIWMAYLGLAAAVRAGSLVSVDLLYRLARGRQRRAARGGDRAGDADPARRPVLVRHRPDQRVRFQNLAGLEIPVSYAYAAIPTGALVSMLAVRGAFLRSAPRRTRNCGLRNRS